MSKKGKYLLIVLLTLVALVACGGDAQEAPDVAIDEPAEVEVDVDEEAGESEEAPDTEAQAPAEFTFTGWAINEGASRDVVMGIMETYEQEANVEIEPQAFPWGEILNQLLLQASGGSAEGAAQLDIAWLRTLAETGALMEIGEYAAGQGYTEAALRSGQVDGVQYGLPWTTGSIGLIANQEILEAAGVTELPATIEEFEAALEAVQAHDPDLIPYAGMTAPGGLKDLIPWIWTFGGTVTDEEGNITLGDEGSVAALEWYKSLLDRGLIAPEMDRFTARQLFSQGRVAFYDDAIVAKGIVTADTPIENLGEIMVPVPRPVVDTGDPSQSMLWGHLVVVFEGEDADEAAEWAQYLTSNTDVVTHYFEELSLPPTTGTALATEAVQEDEFISAWAETVTATADTNPFWVYPESARMESILAENVQAYLVGEVDSAEEALENAATEMTELIE